MRSCSGLSLPLLLGFGLAGLKLYCAKSPAFRPQDVAKSFGPSGECGCKAENVIGFS